MVKHLHTFGTSVRHCGGGVRTLRDDPHPPGNGRTRARKLAQRRRAAGAVSLRSVSRGVLVGLLTAVMVAGGAGDAAAKPADAEHCFNSSGADLNERYGVSEAIVGRSCPRIESGRQWTGTAAWFLNDTFEVVPPGFVPAGPTPLDDWIAKFVEVRYVIDAGTPQEKTYVFPNSDKLWTGTASGAFPVLLNTLTLGTLKPLSVGRHVVDLYWVFSGLTCDGIGDDLEANCVSPGETLYSSVLVDVSPGH